MENSWEYFVQAYTRDKQAAKNQPQEHFVAHQMGELIYNKMGFDGITLCTSDFAFGCYHGFLDKAFRNNLSGLEKAVQGCKKVGNKYPGRFESCAHGIGHGVASYFLVSDLPRALKTCDSLSAGQLSCADGVFMEFSLDAPLTFYKSTDLLYPCDSIDKKYGYSCGKYQPTIMTKMGLSEKNIIFACAASSDPSIARGCFDGVAFSITYASTGNPLYIWDHCSSSTISLFQPECVKTAAGELVFQNIPDWQTNAPLLCNELSNPLRQECLAYIAMIEQQYR